MSDLLRDLNRAARARYEADPEAFVSAVQAGVRKSMKEDPEWLAAQEALRRDTEIREASDNEVLDLHAEQAGLGRLEPPSDFIKRRRATLTPLPERIH